MAWFRKTKYLGIEELSRRWGVTLDEAAHIIRLLPVRDDFVYPLLRLPLDAYDTSVKSVQAFEARMAFRGFTPKKLLRGRR